MDRQRPEAQGNGVDLVQIGRALRSMGLSRPAKARVATRTPKPGSCQPARILPVRPRHLIVWEEPTQLATCLSELDAILQPTRPQVTKAAAWNQFSRPPKTRSCGRNAIKWYKIPRDSAAHR